jgi:prepilin peptidase CpaA
MTYTLPQSVIFACFQLLLVAAAMQDATRLRISNLFSIAIIITFVAWAAIVGVEFDIWQNVVSFLLCLSAGLFLFSKGWLGGGDVKLLAAAALWFDLAGAGRMLVFIMLGGGLLALAIIITRRMIPMHLAEGSGWPVLRRRGPVPYGIAIAAGVLLAVHLIGVHPRPLSPLEQMDRMIQVPRRG